MPQLVEHLTLLQGSRKLETTAVGPRCFDQADVFVGDDTPSRRGRAVGTRRGVESLDKWKQLLSIGVFYVVMLLICGPTGVMI